MSWNATKNRVAKNDLWFVRYYYIWMYVCVTILCCWDQLLAGPWQWGLRKPRTSPFPTKFQNFRHNISSFKNNLWAYVLEINIFLICNHSSLIMQNTPFCGIEPTPSCRSKILTWLKDLYKCHMIVKLQTLTLVQTDFAGPHSIAKCLLVTVRHGG